MPRPSCRVVDVDELVLQPELRGHVLGHGGRAVALGGVMAAGQEGHAHLARVVRLRFRDLAGDEGIGAGRDRGLEVALRAAGAPGDGLDRTMGGVDQRHGPLEHLLDMDGKRLRIGQGLAVLEAAEKTQLLLAEAPGRSGMGQQAELQAELRVVAELGMRVERQVVGEEVDVAVQQQRQPLLHPAGDAAVLAAPEEAVMDEDGIGLGADRGLDQRAARGHARDDLAHGGAALDLQAVRSVVLEALGSEQQVECVQQFVAGGAHRDIVAPPPDATPARMGWPRAARGQSASTKPSAASTAT